MWNGPAYSAISVRYSGGKYMYTCPEIVSSLLIKGTHSNQVHHSLILSMKVMLTGMLLDKALNTQLSSKSS